MDLHKYYKEHKDYINSTIMEIASESATMQLKNKFNLPFEEFMKPEDPQNPDNGCTRFKDMYQDEFIQFYEKEYDRIAILMKFDYMAEDGIMTEE